MELRPRLRPDLEAFHQQEADGSPVLILKDPIGGRFFRITPHEHRFLALLDGERTIPQALDALRERGQTLTEPDALEVAGRADQMGLLFRTTYGTARNLGQARARLEDAKRKHRLAGLFFFYMPLVNPDAFLERTLWVYRLLANRVTALALALLAPGALLLLVSGWPRMQREIVYFFSWQGLLTLWLTTMAIKVIHELGHGYTAKSFGLRVPRMGVAVLMFCPYLYCDTTEAWQLGNRRQRIAVSAAGVIIEVALAILGMYVWHLSRPGIVNSVAMHVAAVSLLSTVLINANPLMKRDGYFVFSDMLDLPNLYGKAAAHVKYLWLNGVLGIEKLAPVAETPYQSVVYTLYGIGARVYSLVITSGIVTMVYGMFDKTLGIVLAALALAVFIVAPLARGLASLWTRREELSPRPARALAALALAALAVYAVARPLQTRSVYPCYVAATQVQQLTVPLHTAVQSVFVRPGSAVRAGDRLCALDAHELELGLEKRRSERELKRKEHDLLLLDEQKRGQAPMKALEVEQIDDEIRHLTDKLGVARGGLVAPFAGVVTRLDARMQPGFRPGEGAVVGELETRGARLVHALVPGKDRHLIAVGQPVLVWLPVDGGVTLACRIAEIRTYSEKDLYGSPFASTAGGEVATEVRDGERRDAPLEAQYTCTVRIEEEQGRSLPTGLTGRIAVPSPPRSMLRRVIDALYQTFNRESLV